jgi:hypothetical protein
MKSGQVPDDNVVDVSTLEAPALQPILAAPPRDIPEDYWSIVVRQFRKNKIAVFGLIIVIAFFALAAFADFIASDKPLMMNYQGEMYFPRSGIMPYGLVCRDGSRSSRIFPSRISPRRISRMQTGPGSRRFDTHLTMSI